MVTPENLKQIFLFQDLPDPDLQKLGAVANFYDAEADTVLFHRGEKLETFYLLSQGKVRLYCRSNKGLVLNLSEVTPGCAFGVSSFIAGTESLASALCLEPCRLITLSGSVMKSLFLEDPRLGYTIMRRVVQLFKSRMNQRTEQFLHSLSRHPDIQACLQPETN